MPQVRGLDDEQLDRIFARVESLVARILRRIARFVAARLGGGLPEAGLAAVSPDDLAPVRVLWRRHLDTEVRPALAGVYRHTAETIADQLAVFGHQIRRFDAQTAEEYLTQAGNRLAGIGDTTWESLRDQLADGVRAGDSIGELAARVRAASGVAEPRARTIARTESLAAHNAATVAQAAALGDPAVTKTWLATDDERTRPTHAVADGQRVKLGEAFHVGGSLLMFPGDPAAPPDETVNCRCSIAIDFDTEPEPTVASGGDLHLPGRHNQLDHASGRGRARIADAFKALIPADQADDALTFDDGRHLDWAVVTGGVRSFEAGDAVAMQLGEDDLRQLANAMSVTLLRDSAPPPDPDDRQSLLLAGLMHTGEHGTVTFGDTDDPGRYLDWSTRGDDGSYHLEVGADDEAVQVTLTSDEMAALHAQLMRTLLREAEPVSAATGDFHLPGRHNQKHHGRRRASVPDFPRLNLTEAEETRHAELTRIRMPELRRYARDRGLRPGKARKAELINMILTEERNDGPSAGPGAPGRPAERGLVTVDRPGGGRSAVGRDLLASRSDTAMVVRAQLDAAEDRDRRGDIGETFARGDTFMSAIAQVQGFDRKPSVGSNDDLDAAVAAGGIEVWRGVRDTDDRSGVELLDEFRTVDEPYWGRGVYGNGVYSSTRRQTAVAYGDSGSLGVVSGGGVLRMVLPADVRVIDYDEMFEQEFQDWLDRHDSSTESVLSDIGRYAMARGYDAIRVDGPVDEKFYVILNRSAVLAADTTLSTTEAAALTASGGGDEDGSRTVAATGPGPRPAPCDADGTSADHRGGDIGGHIRTAPDRGAATGSDDRVASDRLTTVTVVSGGDLHLQGRHDQRTHGRRGGAGLRQRSRGAPAGDDVERRQRRVERVIEKARRTHATDITHAVDGAWNPERDRLQRDIAADLYGRSASVPTDGRAVIAGGIGGAGKSTVLREHADIDPGEYFTINPDDIKEELARRGLIPEIADAADLSPMERVALVHEESSRIAHLMADMAYRDRRNLVWDITMSSESAIQSRAAALKRHGYTDVVGIFVDIPVEVSVSRALTRYRRGLDDWERGEGQGGRFVPPSVIRAQRTSGGRAINRDVFETMKEIFTDWAVYDNSVDGRAPQLVARRAAAAATRREG